MVTESQQGFGLHLRRLRSAAGLSQEDLGTRAGLSTETIGALERGLRRAPYRETVMRLAEALQLTSVDRAQLETLAAQRRARSSKRHSGAAAAPGNLPSSVTSFVGRDRETRALHRLIAKHRMVTLTGTGGIGKTRLAVEFGIDVAGEYQDGAWIVDLSLLGAEESVSSRIAQTLGGRFSDANATDVLVSRLSACEMLIILDNCEAVLSQAAFTAQALLRGSSQLRIIATSRERLSLSSECVLRVGGLSVPQDVESLTSDEALTHSAVRLFTDRSRQNDHAFQLTAALAPVVARMCTRLDGIPLAIELAAARLSTLGPSELDAQLRMALISLESDFRDTLPRHRTMTATIAWSHRLLDESERAVMRRLSVFTGGSSLEAAQIVCQAKGVDANDVRRVLNSLYEKSLVEKHAERFALLQSIQDFAHRELSREGEVEETSLRHAEYFAAFAEKARDSLTPFRYLPWLSIVQFDLSNFTSAIYRALSSDDTKLIAARIIGLILPYWSIMGRRAEGARLARDLLTRFDDRSHPAIVGGLCRVAALDCLGEQAVAFYERARSLYTELRDDRALTIIYMHLARVYGMMGRYEKARTVAGWSWTFAMRCNVDPLVATSMIYPLLGSVYNLEGRWDDAINAFSLALEAARTDNDQIVMSRIRNQMAEAQFGLGNFSGALAIAEELARTTPSAGDQLNFLANVCAYRIALGEIDGARETARDIVVRGKDDMPKVVLLGLLHLASVAAHSGAPFQAARLVGFFDERARAIGYRLERTEEYCYRLLEASLREQLDEATVVKLRAGGAKIIEDDAIAIALAV